MSKIWKLRRQGVLIMTLGLGMILGNQQPTLSLALIFVLYIVWLLVYDYAMTKISLQNNVQETEKSDYAGQQ